LCPTVLDIGRGWFSASAAGVLWLKKTFAFFCNRSKYQMSKLQSGRVQMWSVTTPNGLFSQKLVFSRSVIWFCTDPNGRSSNGVDW